MMSFKDRLIALTRKTRAGSTGNTNAKTQAILDCLEPQLREIADRVQADAAKDAAGEARGWIEYPLKNQRGKPLETPAHQLDVADIEGLPAFLHLAEVIAGLELNVKATFENQYLSEEIQDDNSAFRRWMIRVDGWG